MSRRARKSIDPRRIKPPIPRHRGPVRSSGYDGANTLGMLGVFLLVFGLVAMALARLVIGLLWLR